MDTNLVVSNHVSRQTSGQFVAWLDYRNAGRGQRQTNRISSQVLHQFVGRIIHIEEKTHRQMVHRILKWYENQSSLCTHFVMSRIAIMCCRVRFALGRSLKNGYSDIIRLNIIINMEFRILKIRLDQFSWVRIRFVKWFDWQILRKKIICWCNLFFW